jgi:hypothetical protein
MKKPPQPASGDAAIAIDDLLRSAGFDAPAARREGRRALEAAGLTRAGKTGIAQYKRDAAIALLENTFVVVCGPACRALAPAGRRPVVGLARCEVCGGSNNRRAMLAAARSLREHGVKRVLIIGGRKEQHQEIAGVFRDEGVALQGVIGTSASHTQKDAQANMRRADVMVIWGSTELRHAVSKLYTSEPPDHLRVVQIGRRGTEALCDAIVASFSPRRRRR